ncbi:MAG: 4-alpha-glucanotransferase [Parcubacteria group bacterium GW2011_GWC1_41_7]|nr:MAG: 4-alpha-glucanotransferase [Parcubacteria group bacterium GW2011_GWC1_41_7]
MRRNVLMIGWELPPFNSGGLGVASFEMAKALAEKTKLFFTLPFKFPIKIKEFPLIFGKVKPDEQPVCAYGSYGNSDVLKKQVREYGKNLEPKIKKLGVKFDVIHAHDWLSAPAALYLKKKLHVPVILHIHATEYDRCPHLPDAEIVEIEKECLEQADLIVTVSHSTKEVVKKNYDIDDEKIVPLPNGIDFEEMPSIEPEYINHLKQQGNKIVLFVGRFAGQKGPDQLLDTLPLVKKHVPVKYVFAGSGDLFGSLIRQAAHHRTLSDVVFSGFLRDEQLWSLYKIADVLVVPSISDPFGLVPLEGIKYKTPVIVSRTTGAGDYISHILKADFWDTERMANLIVSLLRYGPLRDEMTENAYQEIPKFNWKHRADALIKIYEKI